MIDVHIHTLPVSHHSRSIIINVNFIMVPVVSATSEPSKYASYVDLYTLSWKVLRTKTHIFTATDLGYCSRFGYRLINAFNQNPVTSRNTIYFNCIPRKNNETHHSWVTHIAST